MYLFMWWFLYSTCTVINMFMWLWHIVTWTSNNFLTKFSSTSHKTIESIPSDVHQVEHSLWLHIGNCLQPHVTVFHARFLIFSVYIPSSNNISWWDQTEISSFFWPPQIHPLYLRRTENITGLKKCKARLVTACIGHHFAEFVRLRVFPQAMIVA